MDPRVQQSRVPGSHWDCWWMPLSALLRAPSSEISLWAEPEETPNDSCQVILSPTSTPKPEPCYWNRPVSLTLHFLAGVAFCPENTHFRSLPPQPQASSDMSTAQGRCWGRNLDFHSSYLPSRLVVSDPNTCASSSPVPQHEKATINMAWYSRWLICWPWKKESDSLDTFQFLNKPWLEKSHCITSYQTRKIILTSQELLPGKLHQAPK